MGTVTGPVSHPGAKAATPHKMAGTVGLSCARNGGRWSASPPPLQKKMAYRMVTTRLSLIDDETVGNPNKLQGPSE